MRLVLMSLSILMGAALCPAWASAPVIAYTLAPVFQSGRLSVLAVTVDFVAGASGQTVVDLPDHYAGQQQLWKSLHDLSVSGAHAQLQPGKDAAHVVVRSDPRGHVVLHYNVVQGFAGEPGQDEATYYRPVVQPGYFHLLGMTVFAIPHGHDKRAVSFRVTGIPKGWNFASTLERTALTVFDLKLSVTVAGDFRIVRVPSSDLRLAIRGHWSFSDDNIAKRVAHIIDAELKFWGDPHSPYLVTVLSLKSDGLSASTGGTGESGGFAMYLSQHYDDLYTDYGFAHERLHGWIPGALGDAESEVGHEGAWLAEGFTDYFARRILLATQVWPLDKTVCEWNRQLLAYDTSPLRAAPNARVAKEMFTNPDMTQIPYWRGAMFALMLDAQLRAKGSNMDVVVREMRVLAKAHPRRLPRDNLVAAVAKHGIDLRGDLARYIDRGEPVWLAPDTLLPCAKISSSTIAKLDAGFDAEATAKNGGVVTGVEPDGPAYRVGLRNGMKIIKRLSPYSIDSRDQRIYSVRDRKQMRTISYLPGGRERERIQTIILDPLASKETCMRVFSASNPP